MAKHQNRAAGATQAAPAPVVQPEPDPAPVAPKTDTHVRRSVVPLRWAKAYAANELKGTCGDALAKALVELTQTGGKADLEKIRALGWANGIDVQERWGARNAGMQRMNLGNVLRGRAKRGEPVTLA